MKRFHVNVSVKNIEQSINFYNDLFNEEPSVLKDNYAKWELVDPPVNFSITPGESNEFGVDHLGIQFTAQDDVNNTIERLVAGKHNHHVQGDVECCYSRSSKVWSADPQDLKWEHFVTSGKSEKFQDKDDIELKLKENKTEKSMSAKSSGSCCG